MGSNGLMKLVAMFLLVASAAAAANDKAVIKHRQGVMDAVGGHFSALFTSANMPGMEQFANQQGFHADALVTLSRIAAEGFPAGSDKGKTKAKAEIWTDQETFKQAMEKFQQAALETQSAVQKGDSKALKTALRSLGGSCKGCHDDFKAD